MDCSAEVKHSNLGGICKLTLRNFSELNGDTVHETDSYEIGNHRWKLAFHRCFAGGCPPEKLNVALLSPNEHALSTELAITTVNQKDPTKSLRQSFTKVVPPFLHTEMPIGIDYDKLKDPNEGFTLDDSLSLIVEMRCTTTEVKDRRSCGKDMEIVNLEILKKDHILDHLRRPAAKGVVSAEKIRSGIVLTNQLISPVLQEMPGFQWLCDRATNGCLLVKQCLNSFEREKRFAEICETCDEGQKWVTLLVGEDDKGPYQRPICEETILLLCKLHRLEDNGLHVLGSVLLNKHQCLFDVLNAAKCLTDCASETEFEFCMEGGISIKNAAEVSPLEVGLKYGSEIIIRHLENEKITNQASLQSTDVVQSNGIKICGEQNRRDLVHDAAAQVNQSVHEALASTSSTQTLPNSVDSGAALPTTGTSGLVPGSTFLDKYLIEKKEDASVVFAVNTMDDYNKVVLRFFSNKHFEKLKYLCSIIASACICKFVEAVDEKDGYPACLVFERGETLEEWMQRRNCNFFRRKAAFRGILESLSSLHECRFVHCNICPRNIVFCQSEHAWQLQPDPDTTTKEGTTFWPQSTSEYAAPEIFEAEESKRNLILETSADMWSAGAVYLKVLTGKGMYSPQFTEGSMQGSRLSRLNLDALKSIPEEESKDLVKKLVKVESSERFSADKALAHPSFGPRTHCNCQEPTGSNKTQRQTFLSSEYSKADELSSFYQPQIVGQAIGYQTPAHRGSEPDSQGALSQSFFFQFMKELEDRMSKETRDMGRQLRDIVVTENQKTRQEVLHNMRQIGTAIHAEVCNSKLVVDIKLEVRNATDNRTSGPSSSRQVHPQTEDIDWKEALSMSDDFLEDKLVFFLQRGRDHRLRISLEHNSQGDEANFEIAHVLVAHDGMDEQCLDVEPIQPENDGKEAVAKLPAAILDSLSASQRSRSCCGSVEKKYVKVTVTIGVIAKTKGTTDWMESSFDMKAKIWCHPVGKCFCTKLPRHCMRCASKTWEKMPQCSRDAIKSVYVLITVGMRGATQVASAAVAHKPVAAYYAWETLKKCFMLPCFRKNS